MRRLFLCFVFIFSTTLFARDIDQKLKEYIRVFRYEPVKKVTPPDVELFHLGRKLFHDKILSLNGDNACSSCHQGNHGGSEPLPLSLGNGASGIGQTRYQENGHLLPRRSPSLIGRSQFHFRVFWDGRVMFHPRALHFVTPIDELNGDDPEYFHIVDALNERVVAAQALFPLLDPKEMGGPESEGMRPIEVWNQVTKNVLDIEDYSTSFRKLFPQEKINIGHIAFSISEFIRIRFQVPRTKFDEYLEGNVTALNASEKRGFLLYNEKARCNRCHFGPGLTNQTMQNVLVPPVGPGKTPTGQDFGQWHATKNENHKYRFLTPTLRGISTHPPFFHNGTAIDLKEVVTHYNDPFFRLNNFDGRPFTVEFERFYAQNISINKNPYHLFAIRQSASPIIQKLGLSESEQQDLVNFLKTL